MGAPREAVVSTHVWASWAPGVRPPSRARPTWDFRGQMDGRNAPPRLSETSRVFQELPENKKWKRKRRQQPRGGSLGAPLPSRCTAGSGDELGVAQRSQGGPLPGAEGPHRKTWALEGRGRFPLKDSLSVHWHRTAMAVPVPEVPAGRVSTQGDGLRLRNRTLASSGARGAGDPAPAVPRAEPGSQNFPKLIMNARRSSCRHSGGRTAARPPGSPRDPGCA